MREISFEKVTDKSIHIVQEIVHSNKEYNVLENGKECRSIKELKEEFINGFSHSFLIKVGSNYVGLLDYLEENPKDHFPWLGLLMIRKSEQGKGYAKSAYDLYEERMRRTGKSAIRLGVLKENKKSKKFWENRGFSYFETKPFRNGKEVDVYQRLFSERLLLCNQHL
ncbi:GNAT family N-acetyltransferase [Metabacillus litoralis]|uniref:GNAT family N-acetyltransferase n=1 Tax=Metabacillus litoralis TaxID=152268 RepID=UPI001CFCAC5C|nr:GNAT family N-acetyltransferase [Metabacillus litoralis]